MHFEQSYDLFMSLIRQPSLSHGWEIWKQSQSESHSSMCWDWPMSQHLLDLRALSYEALWSPRTACAHTAPTAQKWRSSWRVTHRNTRKTVTCKWVKWLRVGTKGCEEMGPLTWVLKDKWDLYWCQQTTALRPNSTYHLFLYGLLANNGFYILKCRM